MGCISQEMIKIMEFHYEKNYNNYTTNGLPNMLEKFRLSNSELERKNDFDGLRKIASHF